jgi:hypothetical protein
LRAAYNLFFFVYLFVLLSYTHQREFASATPVSRLDLLHSLYTKCEVRIDDYHGNTPDTAEYNGHFYSDKAPGTVVISLVPFFVSSSVLEMAGGSVDSAKGWLVTSWFSCVFGISILAAAGGVALFTYLRIAIPPQMALITTLTLILGAAPLPYSTSMFSHALVVGLIAICLLCISRDGENSLSRVRNHPYLAVNLDSERMSRSLFLEVWHGIETRKYLIVAGFASGLALASEYSAGIVVCGLLLQVAYKKDFGWGFFVLGAALPLLLIPLYSYACFGDPFTLPYSHESTFFEMKQGLFAIKYPDVETAIRLLFSPSRGLLFWTPFFGLAIIGYWEMLKTSPRSLWLAYTIPLLQIAIISGRTWDWKAGATIGPRYLAPIIPLLALPCALGLRRFPKCGVLLSLYSVGITSLITLTDACAPYSVDNPVTEMLVPNLKAGKFSPNLGSLIGLSPYGSLAVFYIILTIGFWWLWRHFPFEETGKLQTDTLSKSSGILM